MKHIDMNSPQGPKRVAVIGAGIVGACCAAYLSLEGHDVALLEADSPAAGASYGNAGALSPGSCIPLSMPGLWRKVPSWVLRSEGPLVIRPSYFARVLPWLLRAASAAREADALADALRALHAPVFDCYRPLVEAAGAKHLIKRTGSLVVYRSSAAFEASRPEWEMRKRRGADFHMLEAHEIRQLVPALGPGFERAVLQPDHGYVAEPPALVNALVDLVTENGGQLLQGKVQSLAQSGGMVRLQLDRREPLIADYAVIAAGVGSRRILDQLGVHVPLESQRGYHLHLPTPGIRLPLPVSFAEAKFYATPMADGVRLAGTVEFAGVDAPPDFSRSRQLGELAARWFPDLEVAEAASWMGHRPCLPDSLPAIGPLPKTPHIIAAFGHGHNGMTSAPVTGRIVADLIAGRRPPIDVRPYAIERFE